jgi:U2 small nuclear ribonucleoprotein A'
VKKVSAKTFTPGEVKDSDNAAKPEQGPRVVGPTPEQLTAIKVTIYAFT